MVLCAWAENTNKSYDSVWKGWTTYAYSQNKDPTVKDSSLLNDWVAGLVKNAGAKEGTTEKAATVVSSTWDVIYNPETTLNKIKMAAAKENGAKSKGLSSIWNLYYLHEYVHDIEVDGLETLRDEMQNLIVKFRGATGWRSADLTGVFLEHSITWIDADENTPNQRAGVFLRAWSIKQGQGKWTAATFVPELPPDYKDLCLCYAIKQAQAKILSLGNKVKQVRARTPSGLEANLTPLFIYQHGKSRKVISKDKAKKADSYFPLKEGTIANYFDQYFINNTEAAIGFNAHSCRNAVASLLHAMGVPTAEIAAHMQTSAESLQRTYICTITEPYEPLPRKCIDAAAPLALKLWTAFVHYKSAKEGSSCSCAALISSNSSMEEQRSGAEA